MHRAHVLRRDLRIDAHRRDVERARARAAHDLDSGRTGNEVFGTMIGIVFIDETIPIIGVAKTSFAGATAVQQVRARHERAPALRHGGGHRSAGRGGARAHDARRVPDPDAAQAHRSDRARRRRLAEHLGERLWFALVSRVPSTANTTSRTRPQTPRNSSAKMRATSAGSLPNTPAPHAPSTSALDPVMRGDREHAAARAQRRRRPRRRTLLLLERAARSAPPR